MNIREALDLVSQRNKAENAQADETTNKPLQVNVDSNNVIIQNMLEVIGRGIKAIFWDLDEEVAEYIDDIEFGEFFLWYCATKYASTGNEYDIFTGLYLYDKLGLAQRNTDSKVMWSMLWRIQAEFPKVIRTTSTQGVVEDLIEPVPVSASRSADRYQEKPKKRTRYQNGNDSRWQNPPEDRKTTLPKKANSPE